MKEKQHAEHDNRKKKSRKRKHEQCDAPAADEAAVAAPGSVQYKVSHEELPDSSLTGEVYATAGRSSRQHSMVPEETLKYLNEITEHFKTLIDDEEKELLIDNVLEELAGKELKVAGDPVCSRHVEVLLGAASCGQLCRVLQSIADSDGLLTLTTSPFGSHVIEKVLLRLDKLMDRMNQEEYNDVHKLLVALNAHVCKHLYTYLTDRFATHIARRLLCVACGRDVLPAQKSHQGTAKGGKAPNLAYKIASNKEGSGAWQARIPEIIEAMAAVLVREDYQGDAMAELVYSMYGSPFLQGLLVAVQSNRQVLNNLIPVLLGATFFVDGAKPGKLLEGVPADGVLAMVQDPTGSHLFEAIAHVAPPGVLDELLSRFLKGRLLELSMHASANFAVQALLGAAQSAAQVKAMYKELQSQLRDLLCRRRSGVVAALVAACARNNACHKEVCAALASALTSLPLYTDRPAEQVLAPALLCLDTPAVVGQASGSGEGHAEQSQTVRLSTLGSAILASVLKFSQGSCREFTDSVAALSHHDAVRVARDPSGSRVLEAFLDGSAPAKVKQRLFKTLFKGYGAIATTAPGSYVLEKCYQVANTDIKAAMVGELANHERELEVLHWGPSLLRRMGTEAFKRDPQQWRRHVESTANTLAEFAQLFGSNENGATTKQQKQGKKANKRSNAQAEGDKGTSATTADDDAQAPAKRHKGAAQQQAAPAAAAAAAYVLEAADGDQDAAGPSGLGAGVGQGSGFSTQGQDGQEEGDGRKKKKKQKKHASEAADNDGPAQPHAAAEGNNNDERLDAHPSAEAGPEAGASSSGAAAAAAAAGRDEIDDIFNAAASLGKARKGDKWGNVSKKKSKKKRQQGMEQ